MSLKRRSFILRSSSSLFLLSTSCLSLSSSALRASASCLSWASSRLLSSSSAFNLGREAGQRYGSPGYCHQAPLVPPSPQGPSCSPSPPHVLLPPLLLLLLLHPGQTPALRQEPGRFLRIGCPGNIPARGRTRRLCGGGWGGGGWRIWREKRGSVQTERRRLSTLGRCVCVCGALQKGSSGYRLSSQGQNIHLSQQSPPCCLCLSTCLWASILSPHISLISATIPQTQH